MTGIQMSKASRFQGAFQVLNGAFPECAATGISARSISNEVKFQDWVRYSHFLIKYHFSQSNINSDSCSNAATNTWSHRLKIVIVAGTAGP